MKSKRIVSVKVYIIQLTLIGFVSLSLSSCDVLNYENNVTYETSLEEIYITSIETAPDNELMPLVFVEGKRYWLGKKVKLSEIENYITEDNYLGSINKTVDSTMLPTEELSANFPFQLVVNYIV